MGCSTSTPEAVQSPEPESETRIACEEGDSAKPIVGNKGQEESTEAVEAKKSHEIFLTASALSLVKGRKKAKRWEMETKLKQNCTQMEVIVESPGSHNGSHSLEPSSGYQGTPSLVMTSESLNYFEGTEMKVTDNHLNSPALILTKSPRIQIPKGSPSREAISKKGFPSSPRRSPRNTSISSQRSSSSRTNSQLMKTDTSHISATLNSATKLKSSNQPHHPLKHPRKLQQPLLEDNRAKEGDAVDTSMTTQPGSEVGKEPSSVQSMVRKIWREKPNSQAASVELVGWFTSDKPAQAIV